MDLIINGFTQLMGLIIWQTLYLDFIHPTMWKLIQLTITFVKCSVFLTCAKFESPCPHLPAEMNCSGLCPQCCWGSLAMDTWGWATAHTAAWAWALSGCPSPVQSPPEPQQGLNVSNPLYKQQGILKQSRACQRKIPALCWDLCFEGKMEWKPRLT